MMRLARRRVLTQDMNCIETLARVDVLCVDKTGTITESTMQADEPVLLNENTPVTDILTAFYSGEEPDNDTARALCEKFGQGGSSWFAARSIPFNTAYKYSAKSFGAQGSYVVGAPDILAGARLAELRPVLDPLLAQGRRVLLLARCKGELPDPPAQLDPDTLEFLALLPLQNRIRESAPETFAYFARQGVDVTVISGDDPRAVSHVAAQACIRGADQWEDAATMKNDRELEKAAAHCTVVGRVTPEQKRKLVHALQKQGQTVAMTGDGVNDAPALKVADIGCAMGITGTDVAKGAADMILTDDNFATIVQAVKNGRNVYANIKKAIQFLLSGNTAGILTVLYASLAGLPVPFAAVHLLFINLLTDSLPAIALGLEPHSDAVMQEKPRPRSEGILTKPFLLSVGTEGLVIALATIIAFHIGLASGGAAVASTMAFATLCLSRLFHGFNCKADRPVLFTRTFWNNSFLLGAFVIGAVLLQKKERRAKGGKRACFISVSLAAARLRRCGIFPNTTTTRTQSSSRFMI